MPTSKLTPSSSRPLAARVWRSVFRVVGHLRDGVAARIGPSRLTDALRGKPGRWRTVHPRRVSYRDVPGHARRGRERESRQERLWGIARAGDCCEGEPSARFERRCQLGQRARVFDDSVVGLGDGRVVCRRPRPEDLIQALREDAEFKLAEERDDALAVEVLHAASLEVEFDGQVCLDGHQFLVAEGGLAALVRASSAPRPRTSSMFS